jgi:Pectic acid lyase
MQTNRVLKAIFSSIIVILVIASHTVSFGTDKLPSNITLAVDFNKSIHAAPQAKNPYAAAAWIELTNGTVAFAGHGRFADSGLKRRAWEKSYLTYMGESIPEAQGTIGIDIRMNGKRIWGDKNETWFICLVPIVGEWGLKMPDEEGMALAVYKDAKGDIVLGVYELYKGNLPVNLAKSKKSITPPDKIVARIAAKNFSAQQFYRLRLSWDQDAGQVWLAVDDQIKSAKIKFRKTSWNCLILGSPPEMAYTDKQSGFDGQMDNLLIVDDSLGDNSATARIMPKNLPPAASRAGKLASAVTFPHDKQLKRIEVAARTHLDLIATGQNNQGGWQFSITYPSMRSVLSSKVIVPFTPRYFNGSKAGNSAGIALKYLAAYDALGETKYLDVAKKTAHTLMKLQSKKHGNFFYAYIYDDRTGQFIINHPNSGPFEDHVQSHPVILLYRLYNITGDKKYAEAAERAVKFILRGQNPTGSWSHHFDLKKNYGWTGYRGGCKWNGEINDFTTSDQMTIMLIAYRMTGKIEYLASYLKALDWLVVAFQDGKGKGWSAQYDAENKPRGARHFEPASAVYLSEGATSAPAMLIAGYLATGDKKYLIPLRKWRDWMEQKKEKMFNGKWGWYVNYKIDTGKPFIHRNNQDLPVTRRNLGTFGMAPLLKTIDKLLRGKYKIPRMTKRQLQAAIKLQLAGVKNPETKPIGWNRAQSLLKLFDWEIGSWRFSKNRGRPIISPSTVRILPLLRTAYMERMRRGDIPTTHPMAGMSADDWWHVIYHLMPKAEVFAKLSSEEIVKARAKNPKETDQ